MPYIGIITLNGTWSQTDVRERAKQLKILKDRPIIERARCDGN